MEALKLFAKYAPNKTFFAVLLGTIAGLCYSALIPIVMMSLADDNTFAVGSSVTKLWGIEVTNSKFAALFFVLCVVILIFKSGSEIILNRLALNIRHNLRTELYDRVQRSSISSLEHVGPSRLIQALTTDVSAVVAGAGTFPQIITAVVTSLGVLSFLAYLDLNIFWFVIKVIVFGVVAYQIPIIIGTRYFSKAREHQDHLQEAVKGLIGGAKELKLSEGKKRAYNEQILQKEEMIVKDLEKTGSSIYTLTGNFGNLLCFFAIGGIGFIFINYHAISLPEIFASIMILLYVSGPIIMIMNFVPQLAMTQISLRKIDLLFYELPPEAVSEYINPVSSWQTVTLKDVYYNYPLQPNQSKSFVIGPVNIKINRGEITYITGGNGSGKSTLAKLLTLHYEASEGDIYFDGVKVVKERLNDYRQELSCIYSDYYLFDRLLDEKSLTEGYKEKINYYLKSFSMDKKVQLKDGRFTTLKLSDGQRRRLALIVTIIEDKPLILFDEWAADQDPMFKDIFYREILPSLKKKNKAIVVISHDDRYFDLADQMIIMESGKVIGSGMDNASKFEVVRVLAT
ncbi:cyclic peptide export ABC transporter [Rheinheimera soli]|uniref:ATP-binding cassette transporter n=1 Tax=Rheinheimera soli TaxID=443616 RepID=A0ABU1W531_9GAMM|nr:cyclic peptide export ABC transporter [Rheinheimera soli]MDR7123081.1 putative ATP-binding cassette transporter [Rheinheimera soli]